MQERSYKLKEGALRDFRVQEIATACNVKRQSVYYWIHRTNGITESAFKKLMKTTGLRPSDLLDDSSLEYFVN
jgi:predicted DNA-binding protein YlxM (UPF0122 family)